MSKFVFSAEVFSPRWGHTDRYTVTMTREKMTIQGTHPAECAIGENGDPEWAGYGHGVGNPLMNVFRNDMIFAPTIIPFAMEWAWKKWRGGEVEEADLKEGLRKLFVWIDQTARGKPSGGMWEGAF